MYIEAVHRLSDLGAVVTHAAYGSTQEGFDAEWRMIELLTVGGDNINRCELFDEADLDAALARFEELQPQAPRLENAASQVAERFLDVLRGRRLGGDGGDTGRQLLHTRSPSGCQRRMSDTVETPTSRTCERVAEVGFDEPYVDRHRDPRRAPCPHAHLFLGPWLDDPSAGHHEMLSIVEIDADEPARRAVTFDLDDIDAAFEELDARYLAGEAAAYAHTWSVIARTTAAFNRHELPAADWVTIDHRPLAPIDASDLTSSHARFGTSRRTSASTSRRCIGSAASERSSPIRRMGPRQKASTPSGE